jgi:hypothetical protein
LASPALVQEDSDPQQLLALLVPAFNIVYSIDDEELIKVCLTFPHHVGQVHKYHFIHSLSSTYSALHQDVIGFFKESIQRLFFPAAACFTVHVWDTGVAHTGSIGD